MREAIQRRRLAGQLPGSSSRGGRYEWSEPHLRRLDCDGCERDPRIGAIDSIADEDGVPSRRFNLLCRLNQRFDIAARNHKAVAHAYLLSGSKGMSRAYVRLYAISCHV